MKRLLFAICMATLTFVSANAQNDDITNETILQLLKEGFNSEEVKGAIETSSTRIINYNLITNVM